MEFNPLANRGRGSQPLLLPPGKQPEMELKTFVHKSGSSVWQQTSLPSDPMQHLARKGRFAQAGVESFLRCCCKRANTFVFFS